MRVPLAIWVRPISAAVPTRERFQKRRVLTEEYTHASVNCNQISVSAVENLARCCDIARHVKLTVLTVTLCKMLRKLLRQVVFTIKSVRTLPDNRSNAGTFDCHVFLVYRAVATPFAAAKPPAANAAGALRCLLRVSMSSSCESGRRLEAAETEIMNWKM